MKKRLHILLPIALAIAAIAASCSKIHEFPVEGVEVDPTEITTRVTVKARVSVELSTVITKSGSAADYTAETDADYDRRYTVSIRNAEFNTDEVGHWTIIRDASDTSSLDIDTDLHARKYTMAIWMDYVRKGTDQDLWFDTGNGTDLSSIRVKDSKTYVAGSNYKDGLHFLEDIDLTPYAGQWYCDIVIDAPLQSRMAKIRFLADDLAAYAESIEWPHSLDSLASRMQVKFAYNGYFPTGFNAWTGRLNNSETGYGFDHYCYYPRSFQDNDYTLIGSDYVFVNGESSSVNVSAVITDCDGNFINEVSNLNVPITLGKETVVIYKFFTKEYVPGVGINPDFDGEFNVYV